MLLPVDVTSRNLSHQNMFLLEFRMRYGAWGISDLSDLDFFDVNSESRPRATDFQIVLVLAAIVRLYWKTYKVGAKCAGPPYA